MPIGWLVSLGTSSPSPSSTSDTFSYTATTYVEPTTTSAFRVGSSSLGSYAARATLGEVPRRVVDALNYRGTPAELASQVDVVADEESQWLAITATSPFEHRAEQIADTFAKELVAYLGELPQADIDSLEEDLADVNDQIDALDGPGPSRDDNRQELSNLEVERTDLENQLSALQAESHPLRILENATAEVVQPTSGGTAPVGRGFRVLIAALVGLVVGIAIALFRERLDPRIQDREQAESAFGLPVLADIAKTPRRSRRSVIVTSNPGAPTSNGYQLLAAGLSFGRHRTASRPGTADDRRNTRTILVTSPVGSEGKATTIANLAAAFAGVGKRVIVISCVLDVPSVHGVLGVEQGPGLSDLLDETAELGFDQVLHETTVPGVRLVPAGWKHDATKGHSLFSSIGMDLLLKDARSAADVVLVEAAAVLANSDWAQLIPKVDAVLVVARAGSTTWGSAERSADLLEMLQAPVVGVALVGTSVSSTRRASSRSHGTDRVVVGDVTTPAPVQLTTIVPDLTATDANGNGEGSRDGGSSHAAQPPTDRP